MGNIRFFIARTTMKLAIWAAPNLVRNAMIGVFMDQMRREGIVAIEFGFDDEGDPTMMVRKISDLPIVTRH